MKLIIRIAGIGSRLRKRSLSRIATLLNEHAAERRWRHRMEAELAAGDAPAELIDTTSPITRDDAE